MVILLHIVRIGADRVQQTRGMVGASDDLVTGKFDSDIGMYRRNDAFVRNSGNSIFIRQGLNHS